MNTRQFLLTAVIAISVAFLAVVFFPDRLAVQPAAAANGQTILSISAAAFHPDYSSSTTFFNGTYLGSVNDYAQFSTPLYLPNGVTLNQLGFFYYDNYEAEDIFCQIQAVDISNEENPLHSAISSPVYAGGYAGNGFSATGTFYQPVVDNARFLYYITCGLFNNGIDKFTYLYGVQVTYSYTTYTPLLKK